MILNLEINIQLRHAVVTVSASMLMLALNTRQQRITAK